MIRLGCLVISFAMLVTLGPAFAQSAPAAPSSGDQAELVKHTEAFVRDLFAWGPEFKVSIGPLAPSPSPDFYLAPIHVTVNGQTDTGNVYIGKDGKTFLRGEMFDMAANPFADNLAKLHIDGNPSQGPVDAKVTVVEFSDFECPPLPRVLADAPNRRARVPASPRRLQGFPVNPDTPLGRDRCHRRPLRLHPTTQGVLDVPSPNIRQPGPDLA